MVKIWKPETSISAYLPTPRPPGQKAWTLEGLPGSLGKSPAGGRAEILGQESYQSGQTCLAGLWLLETSKVDGQHTDPQMQASHFPLPGNLGAGQTVTLKVTQSLYRWGIWCMGGRSDLSVTVYGGEERTRKSLISLFVSVKQHDDGVKQEFLKYHHGRNQNK